MRIYLLQLLVVLLGLVSLTCLSKDYPDLNYSATVMADYDHFDSLFLETSDEADEELELRRLRFNITSNFNQEWSAKFKFDVHDGIEIKDAYVKYDAWNWANITVGKQKEPFGLERLMSARNLSLIERSMMSNAIAPARTYGVNLSGGQDSVNWQLGYFQNDNTEKSNAVTGRLTWAPWQKDRNLVHLGAAFSERSLHGTTFRINEELEVNSADSLMEGTTIHADTVSQIGMEFAWQYNGFVNIAEWQQAKVTSTDGSKFQYKGGYYQVSYLFSGKNRKYKNGIIGSVKTQKDWEATLRYSQFKLHEEDSQAKVWSLGINYLLNKNIKLMANYIHADYVDEGIDLGSGNAVSLRALYRF